MNIEQVWPDWHEDCVLGEGSFGKVYRAKRTEYGRTFYSAIKVLSVPKNQQEIKQARSQGMNDAEIYNYFQSLVDSLINEITLMDNLKGAKNIVGIEDYKIVQRQGEIGWEVFIRMELLHPFDSFSSNPSFSQLDVLKLGIDICSALEVCEQNQIVHRDIKPDNIFISKFGEYKLGDFGIARKLEATQANLSRKGTLNYMAPEVYKSEEYGSNVDIYSLGLVLYTLLNNNRTAFLPPFPQPITYAHNEEALNRRLSGENLPYPVNATPSLAQVIIKACAYNPANRYATATEFKNALINEYNLLVQMGYRSNIQVSDANNQTDVYNGFENTTNDMTGNGRVVLDGYGNQYANTSQYGNANQSNDFSEYQNNYNYEAYQPQEEAEVPEKNINRIFRYISYVFAIATSICGVLLLLRQEESPIVKATSFSLIGLGINILLGNRNKLAQGLCVASVSVPFLAQSIPELFKGVNESLPIEAIIILISGLLILFAGIAILFQKEVRLGGTMCMYSIAIMWMYKIYQIINDISDVSLWLIFVSIACVTVFTWSYGYFKKKQDKALLNKILFIVTDVVGAISLLQAVLLVALH